MSCTAKEMVKQMESWIGRKESDGSHKKIIDIYNSHTPRARGYKLKYNDAWCAGTVSASAIACKATDICPIEVGCGKMIDLAKKMGIWVENENCTPKIGWFVFYDWDDNGKGDNKGTPEHVGLCCSVNKSAGTFKVIEGNYGNAVKVRELKINGRYLRGFATPKYDVDPEDIKIYLDYGHGGNDNGAVKYIVEDDTNLVQGRACAAELRAAGFQVKESRTSDKYKSLADRVAEANKWGADLFISFHNNSAGGDGFEAYAMSEVGRAVAKAIEKRVKEFGQNSRGVKDGSGLYVVKYTNMPVALLEGFFVDNKADAAQNDTKAEQKSYGLAVAKGIMDYYNVKPKKVAETGDKKPETASSKKTYSGTFPTLPAKGYLAKGDKGEQVKNLQKFLNWALGAELDDDGSFGKLTESAVLTFQDKYDLEKDGFFGKKSLAKAKTIKK